MAFQLHASASNCISQFPTMTLRTFASLSLLLLAYPINKYLNYRALNNGVSAAFDWKKEIVLVTGGSDGIGAATVQKLAERGTTVIVLDIRPLTYEPAKNMHYFKCDLTSHDGLSLVYETLCREVGVPSCVVACAGICRGKPLLYATQKDIEQTFAINSLGLIWTIQTFVPSMVARNHGHFLIMSSQTAHLATAGVVDYAATKASALAIYEGLQTEMRHVYNASAVRVSCVSPSAVQTKMFRGIKLPPAVSALQPSDVGSIISEILWSGKAQNRMTPLPAYLSPATRAFPDWMRVKLQDFGKDVMTTLSPHQPMEEA
ncbi:hypothetical protein N7456_002773 [Penicillium angulare]|uniref:Short-chain dehydrogenase/reductase SDR n=1 Tax=Penicillium angulare TaxID=116970 RepID=A0A9W9KPB5_9EURO|nr:hypothetical protein N7456_002773 [Penicillium angulare]